MFDSYSSLIASVGLIYLAIVSWPLAVIDIKQHRLPNKLVLPAFPITLLGQLISAVIFQTWQNILIALASAVVMFALTLGINRLGLLGMGDVKLMSAMALGLGWFALWLPIAAMLFTFLAAGLVALGLLVFGKLKLGASMALGPYLLAGFFGAITLGAWS